MHRLFRLVSRTGVLYALLWARIQLIETKIRMRNIMKGILLVWMSKVFWFFGFGMLLMALFFHYSELWKFSSADIRRRLYCSGLHIVFWSRGG